MTVLTTKRHYTTFTPTTNIFNSTITPVPHAMSYAYNGCCVRV